MAAVYPYLYVLENSIRDVVKRVMETNHGSAWWDTALTSGQGKVVKNNVEQKLRREDEQTWHQRRGAHPIDYTTLGELKAIAVSQPNLFFPRILNTKAWFEAMIEELEPSRNVLCHMNPLSTHNVAAVKLRFNQWNRHLTQRKGEIEAAMMPKSSRSAGWQALPPCRRPGGDGCRGDSFGALDLIVGTTAARPHRFFPLHLCSDGGQGWTVRLTPRKP
jgi:hypothetical protein